MQVLTTSSMLQSIQKNMIIPPIKIQGKKTKLVPYIIEIANELHCNNPKIDTWVEPFLGSGVVAFNVPSYIKKVIVNDINPHIIKFYKSVASGEITKDTILDKFKVYSENLLTGGYDYYNEVKNDFNTNFGTLEFLFLTRTGFNGVMRFNRKGLWNVPFCKLNNRLSDKVINDLADSVEELSKLFKEKNYEFYNQSFDSIIDIIPQNSIVYCDPPYFGLQTQYYTGWNEDAESRLNWFIDGKTFIYSTWVNDGIKDNPMIDKYWSKFDLRCVEHKYNVANKASDRNKVIEGIIYNLN